MSLKQHAASEQLYHSFHNREAWREAAVRAKAVISLPCLWGSKRSSRIVWGGSRNSWLNDSQGELAWVSPSLVVVRVTFSKCLLALCLCAGTGLPDTPSPSLPKDGRHHGLLRLPLGYGALRYEWVSVTPPSNPWEVVTPCTQTALGTLYHFSSQGSAVSPGLCQAVPASEQYVFLSCHWVFFMIKV